MSTTNVVCSNTAATGQAETRSLSYWRWLWLCGLLAAEFLFLSIRFDTGSLTRVDSGWAALVESGHLVIQFFISVLAAMLIFRGEQVCQGISRVAAQVSDAPMPWLPLTGHLAALLVFYRLTVLLLEGGVLSTGWPGAWVISWGCVGTVWLACWFAAAIPATHWRALATGDIRWLFIGSALAAVMAVIFGQFTDQLWQPLSRTTFWFVEQMLRLFYSSLIVDTDRLIIGTNTFSVEIAPQCSGYEGIGLVAVFLAIFLWVFRHDLRFPNSLLLLPIGCAVIWLANVLRIALLVVIGTSLSPAVAAGGFHTQAGWLAFNAVTLGLVAVAWNSSFFAKATARSNSIKESVAYPGAPYLLPFLVLVGTAMLTKAFSSGGVDQLYSIRVVTTTAVLIYFWHSYREGGILQWSWSLPAAATGVLVFGIWVLLEQVIGTRSTTPIQQAHPLANMSTTLAAAWIVLRVIGSIAVVPLAEELAFRGYLTRRLQAADFETVRIGQFSWISFATSSVCFGALHGRWLAGILAGMAYALILYRRGRLFDAVLAHATTNALLTCYVLYTGCWSLWS